MPLSHSTGLRVAMQDFAYQRQNLGLRMYLELSHSDQPGKANLSLLQTVDGIPLDFDADIQAPWLIQLSHLWRRQRYTLQIETPSARLLWCAG